MNKFRGTGRTTKQMTDAPRGSIFVWCNSELSYPKRLARSLDRGDLKIIVPSSLEWDRVDRFRGTTYPAVIIDHATTLSGRQFEAVQMLLAGVRP